MTIESTLEKANSEASAGRLWRAKEILISSVRNYGYSLEIFQRIAEIAIEMGDAPLAGKFLLLCRDDPNGEELELIDVFLKRAGTQNYRMLLGQLPKIVSRTDRENLPRFLNSKLKELNTPLSTKPEPLRVSKGSKWISLLVPVTCLVIATVCLAFFTIGLGTVLVWLW